jgi:hypothetical protein
MMQEWIVGAIVACAFWAVLKRYMPKAVRKAVRSRSVRLVRRLGWNKLANWLEAEKKTVASCADGCGSCGGCGSKGEAPPAADGKPVIPLKLVRHTASR